MMNNCLFFRGGTCQCLTNIDSCPKDCKFRKTEQEYYAAQREAEKILEAKGLTKVMVHTNNGPIISVRKIEC